MEHYNLISAGTAQFWFPVPVSCSWWNICHPTTQFPQTENYKPLDISLCSWHIFRRATFLGNTSPKRYSVYLPRHLLWDDAFSLSYFICRYVYLLILFLCSCCVREFWNAVSLLTNTEHYNVNIFKCRVNIYLSYIKCTFSSLLVHLHIRVM